MKRTESASGLVKMLNELDEFSDVEAKQISGNELGRPVYETICSMSNEPGLGGGTKLLGVAKEEGTLFPLYTATGVRDPDKLTSDLVSACATMFNHPVRVRVAPEKVDEKVVLRIDVSELPEGQKPLYFKKQLLPSGAYRRIGSADIRCTGEDLVVFFSGKVSDPHDAHLVQDASWDDVDPQALEAYRKARAKANPHAEELTWGDEDMLRALGAARVVDGALRITVTGILVFGKSTAIRRLFPSHRVDYIRLPGTRWVSDPDESFETIDMRGSLLSMVPRLISAIFDDLPRTLTIGERPSGQRTETPILPLRVVREAVVNALMHRNYQVYQPIQILRYANRIEIRNPGHSLKPQERFDDPGSQQRNPHIAAIFHETNLAETKGSGIRVMRRKMAEAGLTPPAFDSDREKDEFSAIYLFHHFLNEADIDWLSNFKSYDLSENQMRALIFVREVEAIDNSVFRDFAKCDNQTASRELRRLREHSLLTVKGTGVRTYYIAGPEMLKTMEPRPSTMEPRSRIMEPSSHDKPVRVKVTDLPATLRHDVQNYALGKRLTEEYAYEIIAAMCAWRPLSANEIADLLGKTSSYISQAYLGPMIKSGKLSYVYPEMVHHPEQRYVAKKRNGH